MMKLTCYYADVCLPDYWGGHHLPHIAVPVTADTTADELRSGMLSELYEGAVMGAEYNPGDDAWHDDAAQAVKDLLIISDTPFAGLEGDDNQAYFVFREDEQ